MRNSCAIRNVRGKRQEIRDERKQIRDKRKETRDMRHETRDMRHEKLMRDQENKRQETRDMRRETRPPAPMNHVKYLSAGPAEMSFRNWYTANTTHFHLTDSVSWK